jgi:hypothetical protein
MVTPPQDMAVIWTQKQIPVVYRQRGSKPVLIRLPYNDDNRTWLKGDHRRKPVWNARETYWEAHMAKASLTRVGHAADSRGLA